MLSGMFMVLGVFVLSSILCPRINVNPVRGFGPIKGMESIHANGDTPPKFVSVLLAQIRFLIRACSWFVVAPREQTPGVVNFGGPIAIMAAVRFVHVVVRVFVFRVVRMRRSWNVSTCFCSFGHLLRF